MSFVLSPAPQGALEKRVTADRGDRNDKARRRLKSMHNEGSGRSFRESSAEDHLSDVTHEDVSRRESAKSSSGKVNPSVGKENKKLSSGKMDIMKDSQKMVARSVGHKKERDNDMSVELSSSVLSDEATTVGKRGAGIKKLVQLATEKVGKAAGLLEENAEFSYDEDEELEETANLLEKKVRKGYARPPAPDVLSAPEMNCSPVELPAKCGEAVELLLLGHNAIRAEVVELMTAVSAIKDRGENASDRQFAGFFKWWSEFVEHLHVHIELEDEVVLPFLRRHPFEAGQLSQLASGTDHTSLFLQLNTIGSFKRQIGRNKNKKLGETLFAYLSDFVKHILLHCSDTESVALAIIKQLSPSSSAKLAENMHERLRESRYLETLALMLRGTAKQLQKDYISRKLKKQEAIKYRIVKLNLEHKRSVTLELAYKDGRDEKDTPSGEQDLWTNQ